MILYVRARVGRLSSVLCTDSTVIKINCKVWKQMLMWPQKRTGIRDWLYTPPCQSCYFRTGTTSNADIHKYPVTRRIDGTYHMTNEQLRWLHYLLSPSENNSHLEVMKLPQIHTPWSPQDNKTPEHSRGGGEELWEWGRGGMLNWWLGRQSLSRSEADNLWLGLNSFPLWLLLEKEEKTANTDPFIHSNLSRWPGLLYRLQ